MNRTLLRTAAFVRAARRYVKRHPQSAEPIRVTLELMERDVYDPRLRTHKLQGELAGSWACSAGYDLRIIFELVQHEGAEAILLLSVGSHDEVY